MRVETKANDRTRLRKKGLAMGARPRDSLSASTCQKSGELHQWEASEGRYQPFVVGGSGKHGNIRPGQRKLLFESISPNPAFASRADENHPISGMSYPLGMHSLTKGLPLRSGMPRLAAVCSRYRKQGRGYMALCHWWLQIPASAD